MYDDYDEFDEFDEFSLENLDLDEHLAAELLLDDSMLRDLRLVEFGDEEPEIFLDVPFVPTDEKIVQAMLDMAKVTSKDILYDLGCGDGRIVVAAAMERNARAIGIDLDPARIADAMEYAGNSRVEHMVDFIEGDLLEADFSEATVVTLYLLDMINLELRPRLQQELKPGTRIVSHAFDMSDWKPDQHANLAGVNLFLWIVPAQVAGNWQWYSASGDLYQLRLRQKHQKLSGEVRINGNKARLNSALVHGDLLEFRITSASESTPVNFVMRYVDDQLLPHDKQLQPEPATRVVQQQD